ncbi:hypothetical protein K9L63_00165 [Candidatus Gracilibacteria bacterium]|nr:hypothetical protein [Candidatus Gracilibacteria bacterium]
MKYLVFLVVAGILLAGGASAKSNACDRHGGMSYCGTDGQYVCNDGTTDSFSICGGTWTHTAPSMDFTLFPPKTVSCPSNADYSYSASNCVCRDGFQPSEDRSRCVRAKINVSDQEFFYPRVRYQSWKSFGNRPRNIYFPFPE